MKWIVITLFVLIGARPANGQGENAGLGKAHREMFEEALRWKLSAAGYTQGTSRPVKHTSLNGMALA
jgi:hypothetical protein